MSVDLSSNVVARIHTDSEWLAHGFGNPTFLTPCRLTTGRMNAPTATIASPRVRAVLRAARMTVSCRP